MYQAARLTTAAPSIDGILDEACWASGEWSGDFVQREPYEGRPPSFPTALKIVYDDRNVYVAIRATDPDVARQPRLLGRRDEFTGDMVGVAFDSYFNRQTGFEFDVTSGGSKIDLILRNDGSVDLGWNPVWDVEVAIDEAGWTAEFRIPLSQLRYSRAREQVWGLHSWRWLRREAEESNWNLIPMDHGGFVHAFGELRGIRDLPPSRRIELLPYAVVKHQRREREAGNPYRDGGDTGVDGGLDAKVGLGSDFTLDLTVNPDFGQVEADPSQINLGTFETFFPERRPFFVEGQDIFTFELGNDLPFYSRRIGDAPSLQPTGPGFVKMPESTRILTAEKITGRTAGGFSLGVLHSLADRMEAQLVSAETGEEQRLLAEPRTNYVVLRGQNDFDRGNTLVGGLLTAVRREGGADELGLLTRQAVVGGGDVLHYWSDRTYFVEGQWLASRVEGSPNAITALMTNPVHNYQRPDAAHVQVDPEAETLQGHAGTVRGGKAKGRWRYEGEATWRSPGVEFNDVGYLRQADFLRTGAEVSYYNAEAGARLRRREVALEYAGTYDFDGELLRRELELDVEVAGLAGWYLRGELGLETGRLDPRVLRGGPALRLSPRVPLWVYAESDNTRPLQGTFATGFSVTPDTGANAYWAEPGLRWRVGDRLRIDAGFEYERNRPSHQYVGQAEGLSGTEYVVGRMDQTTLMTEFRVQAMLTPKLELTYYGAPFASVGRFDRFSRVAWPRAGDPDERYELLNVERTPGGYQAAQGFGFEDPDFSWREFKSNLVLRWEFRPGSTLYCVWSQHRTNDERLGAFAGLREYRELFRSHPDNTFLVKVSYWFSI